MNFLAKLLKKYDASYMRIGDHVQWIVDVDKVYSKDTKMYVGKVGVIIPRPSNALWEEDPLTKHVVFPSIHSGIKAFTVYNINIDELVKVKWDYDLGEWFNPMSISIKR